MSVQTNLVYLTLYFYHYFAKIKLFIFVKLEYFIYIFHYKMSSFEKKNNTFEWDKNNRTF